MNYKHTGWQGYGHWLGTGNIDVSNDKEFLPFKKALLHARSLTLKTQRGWAQWCESGERPVNIPSRPDVNYKHNGWQEYGHWLGTGNLPSKEFLPFKKALLHARSLELQTRNEWKQWCKSKARPANIPSHPGRAYAHDGWQGYGHRLGSVTV